MEEQAQMVEKRGRNVDEAVKAALDELNCDIEDVVIEIIEESSKGLLGIVGKKPAIVKVTMLDKPEQEIRKVLENLLNKMKIDYEISNIEYDKDKVRINIIGKDMGLLIGRKGETLNTLQYMVGLIINRKREDRIRVILDVEDYRKKREESLEALALRLSEKVKETRKNVVMRPMNSQERRIVHTALQGDPSITTYSIGEEPNRKLVITLKK
ncbi:MAG TPA: RNA-binding cell elongation regulator Jag/EloR [Syntrophomonadaceae bacterium]|nr:RNA-binding cell elongation regulator Jag/EloR [Syntrophomonadaceae bacterium]HPR93961.1 RNA-binding cell elongation regulator Jag/EloR [Syntrophomonadaceae bacterium]